MALILKKNCEKEKSLNLRYPKARRNEGSVAGGTSLLIWFDRWAVVFEGRSITSERLDTYEQKRENESERLNYFWRKMRTKTEGSAILEQKGKEKLKFPFVKQLWLFCSLFTQNIKSIVSVLLFWSIFIHGGFIISSTSLQSQAPLNCGHIEEVYDS